VTGGGLALFSYSLGLGLPFWLVGSLSLGLPKPGLWMDRVKSLFGVILMVLALYYLRHIVPVFAAPPRGLPTSGWFFASLLIAGLALGAVHLSLKDGTSGQRARKLLGVVLAAIGGVWLVAYEPPAPAIAWIEPTPDLAALARQRHQPVLVDFGATWCAACDELLRHTFSDPAVRQEARRFVTVRVDATESTPALDALQALHHVRGLPTVLLFDTDGREVARIAEFVPAPRMLQLMRTVH
jgi:thioredoxin:protein disulfide reductase